jgi:hypothetical protein
MIKGEEVDFHDKDAHTAWSETPPAKAVYSQFLFKLKFDREFLFSMGRKKSKPIVCVIFLSDNRAGFYATNVDQFMKKTIKSRIFKCFSQGKKTFDSCYLEAKKTEEVQREKDRLNSLRHKASYRARQRLQRLVAQMSDQPPSNWSIVNESGLIQFIYGHAITKRILTSKCESLSTAASRTSPTEMKDGSSLVRYAICQDGHCLLDSLSFLYLYHYPLAGANDEDVLVKLDSILLTCGWRPAPSKEYLSTMKTKGNLMDVLCGNVPLLLHAVSQTYPPLQPWVMKEVKKFFANYMSLRDANAIQPLVRQQDYPNEDVALFLKRLLFKDDVMLCIHAAETPETPQRLLLSRMSTSSAFSSFHYIHSNSDAAKYSQNKKVHMCHLGNHYEPAAVMLMGQHTTQRTTNHIDDYIKELQTI